VGLAEAGLPLYAQHVDPMDTGTLVDMFRAERDACLFYNVARIEAAVKAGKFKTIGTSKVPVVDGTHEGNKDPKTALVAYVIVPKNPHGVNASPGFCGVFAAVPGAVPEAIPAAAGDAALAGE
jgi:nitrous oxide reductase